MIGHTRTLLVLLTPALATLPPKLGWIDMMMDDVHEYWRRVFHFSPFTVWFNLTGQPAASVPCGFTRDGLPIGLQIVGPWHAEARILQAARAYETVHPFKMPTI